MGLLDVLNGMQNGPRGASRPAPAGQGGGMSPWMMALLGMLAYKAVKGGGIGNMLGGGSADQPRMPAQPSSGGLGDALGGLLGGSANPSRMPGQAGGGSLADMLGGLMSSGGPSASGGGLGGILGGLLGGAGGGSAGSVLNGGLRNLLQDMDQNGQGDTARSWVGTGENRSINPNDLARAIGLDDIAAVSRQTGMSQDELVSQLSQHLPDFVDRLTPDGRMPSDQEASRS